MMRKAKIIQLFLLFAGLEHAAPFEDTVEAAIEQVRGELKADADESDIRLCYYTAAVANMHYRQMIAARGAVSPTYAGTVSVQRNDTQPCTLAERLMSEYRKAAAALLRDDAFVFQTIPDTGGLHDGN